MDSAQSNRPPTTTHLIEAITSQEFKSWYQNQQAERNIRDGKAHYNTPSPAPEAIRHSPSKLVQCHRKLRYDEENAPEEGTSPEGLFWIGSKFEEEVIVPYFQTLTTDDTYVQNSLWIDTTVTIDSSDEIQIRGSTDPVFVTEDGDPLLVTEVKTTSALDRLTAPRKHHKAQLHAYLYGLDKEYDYPIQDGIILYGDRTDFAVKTFHVPFNPDFWEETVVAWMEKQTESRQTGELPAADPVFGWECDVCSYRHRCGQADTSYADHGPTGFLPFFTEYQEQHVRNHLEAYTEESVKLTPTLAHQFPDLRGEYPISNWSCNTCKNTFEWDAVTWNPNSQTPPVCPHCSDNKLLKTLSPSTSATTGND